MARLEMMGLDIGGGVCLRAASLKETERQLRANTYWVGGCVCVLVTQLHPTLCDPINCSPLGSSVCGIPQARILEWVAISFSVGLIMKFIWVFP